VRLAQYNNITTTLQQQQPPAVPCSPSDKTIVIIFIRFRRDREIYERSKWQIHTSQRYIVYYYIGIIVVRIHTRGDVTCTLAAHERYLLPHNKPTPDEEKVELFIF